MKERWLLIVTAVLSATTVRDAVSLSSVEDGYNQELTAGDASLHILDSHVQFSLKPRNKAGQSILDGKLGLSLPATLGLPTICNDADVCLEWGNRAKLHIKSTAENCLETTWSGEEEEYRDCFDLGDQHWYGGLEVRRQTWPIETVPLDLFAYITNGEDNRGVVESYWLNSNGTYLYVPEDVPLFVSVNSSGDNQLCLVARADQPYIVTDLLTLKYNVCSADDAKLAHLDAVNSFLGTPKDIPDERMIRHPIWSTWAEYKQPINESVVLSLANEIVNNGFNNSQLEIDDKWERNYGDFTFDIEKFPNISSLTQQLKDMGFRVTLWLYPYVNVEGSNIDLATDAGYLVSDADGNVGLTNWWDGTGGVVDFTNPEAADWYVSVVRRLRDEDGIDSFKFDSGEATYLPESNVLKSPPELQPNVFTTEYVKTVSTFGGIVEVRVGRRTQELAIFTRMLDKDTSWGYDNGLKTLVTTLLQMNMVGYPFVLPDMIGGNGYGTYPTKEIFIRWLQANTFMPSLQFSYVPWDFDDETIEISRKYTALHEEYADTIISLARKAVEDGSPINPPIWWVDPTDVVAHAVDSEYLLGEDILVAPILDEGSTTRDIYLPAGNWYDNLSGDTHQGPIWLTNYSVALDELPYFTRQPSQEGAGRQSK